MKKVKSLDFTIEDKIDFDPIRVKSVRKVGNNLVISMPSQPCYSQRAKLRDGVERIPRYEVEFIIYDGEVSQNTLKPPFKSQHWNVRSALELRACFLPVNYSVESPVTLTFECEEKTLKIYGSKFELKVVKQKRSCLAYTIT